MVGFGFLLHVASSTSSYFNVVLCASCMIHRKKEEPNILYGGLIRYLTCFGHLNEPSPCSRIAIQRMCSTCISDCDDPNDSEGSEHVGKCCSSKAYGLQKRFSSRPCGPRLSVVCGVIGVWPPQGPQRSKGSERRSRHERPPSFRRSAGP